MPAPPVLPPDFPERFTVEWGQDEYGVFMAFAVNRVVQRMRWIPPGTFWMGSPENEVGRSDDEVLHRVELTQGVWLGDTPVTQALWEAVMGTNPSEIKGAIHPVETVSWNDCQMFIQRLNDRVEGLDARMPTEAEWEYACRAGTKTATWIGNLHGSNEEQWARQLDSIAWYRANAGRKTHPVAQKAANPWGLYDMLGNMWELCADWFGPYDVTMVQDPRGPVDGANRVMRGGSWRTHPIRVRAGHRNANLPVNRSDRIGFRLARSPAPRLESP